MPPRLRDDPLLVDPHYACLVLVQVVQALPIELSVLPGHPRPGGATARQVILHALLVLQEVLVAHHGVHVESGETIGVMLKVKVLLLLVPSE